MINLNQYDYYCPKCKGLLSKNNQVVFEINKRNKERGKLMLDPKPGSYNYKCKPQLQFDKNELVDFNCPKCKSSLSSEKYNKFVQIHLKVTEKVLIDVFFSRMHGVHKTYVGIEDFEEEYGDEIRQF